MGEPHDVAPRGSQHLSCVSICTGHRCNATQRKRNMGVAFKRGGGYNTQHECCISSNGLFTWSRRNQPMAVNTDTPNDTKSTDRIEKRVVLRASRTRVWRALTNAAEFGTWFRVKLEGAFAAGRPIRGRMAIPGYEHVTLELLVERIDPERYFAYRWHPYAVAPGVDYSAEPTTLVEFRLEDAPGGTSLTIVESGFDRLPPGRRDEAFRMNEGGWGQQIENVARHVAAG